jgi:hypothetical protein
MLLRESTQEAAMSVVEKLIVTNRSALKCKYGTALAKIDLALGQLIAADAARGLTTKCVALDDAAALARAGGKPVPSELDDAACKRALDKLAAHYQPDYVVILGAPDVVPHVRLTNPTDDEDPSVPSDLPYACDEPFSRDARKFLSPRRVVGRLPDLAGAKGATGLDPGYLVRQLRRAAKWKSRPRSAYESHFGLSTHKWRRSTALSLANLYGGGSALLTSPPDGPTWKSSLLARRVHFINCHGGPRDWLFYGEGAGRQPSAHDSRHLDAKRAIADGTVIAAECCYGAELYDPTPAEPRGICSAYLDLGAHAFMGSTTIAYGPSSGNGYADLICQYFLERVLRGASTGRALLEARQRYLQAAAELDDTDLKTIAQFHLLGDPSIHPVERAPHALVDSAAFSAAFASQRAKRAQRLGRRMWLLRSASMLDAGMSWVAARGRFQGGARVGATLRAAAEEEGLVRTRLYSHRLRDPIGRRLARELGARDTTWVHALVGGRLAEPPADGTPDVVKIVALVRGREIVSLRKLEAR